MGDLEYEIRDAMEWRLRVSPVWKNKSHQRIPRGRTAVAPMSGSIWGLRLALSRGISVVTQVQAGYKDGRLVRGPKPAGAAVAMPGFPNTSSTRRTQPAVFPVRGLVTKVARGCYLSPRACRALQMPAVMLRRLLGFLQRFLN